MSKYNNSKVQTPDGEMFDSVKEYKRCLQLRTLQRAGKISELQRQVKFELIPAQYEIIERYGKTGRRLKDERKMLEQATYYVADFVYKDKDGKTVVEDVKGWNTSKSAAYSLFVVKRKLMLYRYGIKILET